MNDERTTFLNGIRPNGSYAYPLVPDEELGRRLLAREGGRPIGKDAGRTFRRPMYGVNVDDLAASGWGVVFPSGTSSRIRNALRPLLDRRKAQAGARYQPLQLYPNETHDSFLQRHGADLSEPDPDRLPYYLLLVGSPEEIPFEFQWELDHLYAVGRIHFDDPEDYAAYARRVTEAEDRESSGGQGESVTFFGVTNENDSTTRRTTEDLVLPLADEIDHIAFGRAEIRRVTGAEATRAALTRHLGGPETPDVLFTASHGMVFEPDDPRQRAHQGALLCSDWPGRGHPVERDHYLAAEDLDPEGALPEIAFHFACHSGGTPEWDSFPKPEQTAPERLAPEPFLAALPRRLLAHPAGGSRAVIAHVDRAWTTSFDWNLGRGGPDKPNVPKIFQGALAAILDGRRIGFAMESFGALYGAMSRSFASHWEERTLAAGASRRGGATSTPDQLARTFRGANDARSFLVFGDPAVRLHHPTGPPPV